MAKIGPRICLKVSYGFNVKYLKVAIIQCNVGILHFGNFTQHNVNALCSVSKLLIEHAWMLPITEALDPHNMPLQTYLHPH